MKRRSRISAGKFSVPECFFPSSVMPAFISIWSEMSHLSQMSLRSGVNLGIDCGREITTVAGTCDPHNSSA